MRRTPVSTSGSHTAEGACAHCSQKTRKEQNIQTAAPTSDACSLHFSSRRKMNISNPARKKVIVARYVRLFGMGRRSEERKNDSYGVGCADAARMSPQKLNG